MSEDGEMKKIRMELRAKGFDLIALDNFFDKILEIKHGKSEKEIEGLESPASKDGKIGVSEIL